LVPGFRMSGAGCAAAAKVAREMRSEGRRRWWL